MPGAHWFDHEKLLPGESLVREGFARLRTVEPPYWWEGDLILTSERLFFLPNVHNPTKGRSSRPLSYPCAMGVLP